MSLFTELLGTISLSRSKPEVIRRLRALPNQELKIKERALQEWGVVNEVKLSKEDYEKLRN